jgi:uncharacterized protein YbgA (DUF1722 family)/uncharacterized protein YbbK (DUF523 family)
MYRDFIPKTKIRLGISACLLGEPVRFDGGHKRSAFCTDALSDFVEYVPLCPEAAIGLGVPRPTIRLEQHDDTIIATSAKGNDVTEALAAYGKEQAVALDQKISGYIFCAKSPSCGMERVKLYKRDTKMSTSDGVGLFAKEIMQHNPILPVEENGRINDALLRENFITRVYAYSHWQHLMAEGLTAGKLIEFHSQYKYLLMAHNIAAYKALGQLLSNLSGDLQSLSECYIVEFMRSISSPVSRKAHTNVLQHLQGYFKTHLSSAQRQEFAKVITDYRQGHLPLLAPLTLIRHFLAEYPDEYVAKQRYLHPYPDELKLRYAL